MAFFLLIVRDSNVRQVVGGGKNENLRNSFYAHRLKSLLLPYLRGVKDHRRSLMGQKSKESVVSFIGRFAVAAQPMGECKREGLTKCLEKVILQEIPLRTTLMHTPPIIDCNIEHAQSKNQKCSGKLGFEPNGDHDTSRQSNQAYESPRNRKLPVDDESDKQKDEEDPPRQLKVFLSVRLVDLERRETWEKTGFVFGEGVREDHEETTDYREVAQEKVDVEDKAVSETLGDYYR